MEERGNGGAGASLLTARLSPLDPDKGLVDKGEDKSPLWATPLLVREDDPNLLGSIETLAEMKLPSIYRDYLHNNNGTHMTGGVGDKAAWKCCWQRAASLPQRPYGLPMGKV